ncbi:MAG: hypothetical protein JXA46_17745 [Dehalococcoidales bacterium]|nr:hypothetical protein [Dehalococcoidales bacterium]
MSIEGKYDLLNPWADIDPLPLKGLAPRLSDLTGKTIGLFRNDKRSSKPTMEAIEKILGQRFPTIKFVPFFRRGNISVIDTEFKADFEKWIKEIDGAIYAYGD